MIRTGTRARGFTLVELMVAATIGLVVIAAVSAVFVTTRRQHGEQERMARISENGRFALQFLAQDVRHAGYAGCLRDRDILFGGMNPPAAPGEALRAAPPSGLLGPALGGNAEWLSRLAAPLPGTDTLTVRMMDPSASAPLQGRMAHASAPPRMAGPRVLEPGDLAVITDCAAGDRFVVASVDSAGRLRHDAAFSKAYAPPARIGRWLVRTWFLRINPAGVPALYRLDNDGNASEVVEGIEDLRFLYGIDTDSPRDGAPNLYLPAREVSGDGWTRIVAIKVWLLARALERNEGDADLATHVGIDGEILTGLAPGYRRRVFSATVQPRNLP